MDAFYDPDIEDIGEAIEAIDHYEWAITDDSEHGQLITKWTYVQTPLQIPLTNKVRMSWYVPYIQYCK